MRKTTTFPFDWTKSVIEIIRAKRIVNPKRFTFSDWLMPKRKFELTKDKAEQLKLL